MIDLIVLYLGAALTALWGIWASIPDKIHCGRLWRDQPRQQAVHYDGVDRGRNRIDLNGSARGYRYVRRSCKPGNEICIHHHCSRSCGSGGLGGVI